jgi:hypothetical protein
MNRLSFNPRTVVIPSEDALHILTGRGTGTLKSASSLLLHQALLPHLNGTHDAEELIAASDNSAAVKAYLDTLNHVGALLNENELQQESQVAGSLHSACQRPEELGPECAQAIILHDHDAVFVSLLQGAHSPSQCGKRCIHFLTAIEMGRELLALDQKVCTGCTIFYVVTPELKPNLYVRAAYARWLLANRKNMPRLKGSIRIYRLDPEKNTLAFVLGVNFAKRHELKSLPEKLGLVSPVDVDQVPLAVAEAKSMFFSQAVAKFGLQNDDRLHEELIAEFLLLALHASDPPPTILRKTYVKKVGSSEHSFLHVHHPAIENTLWEAAPDNWTLRLRLLEKYIYACNNTSSEKEVDLLREEAQHPNIEYLKQILRIKNSKLPARMQTTREGLCIYETMFRRYFSFIPAKALQDALLGATWRKQYSASCAMPSIAGLQYDFAEFLTRRQLRDLVVFHEKNLRSGYPPAQFELRLFRCWARSVWAGRINFL